MLTRGVFSGLQPVTCSCAQILQELFDVLSPWSLEPFSVLGSVHCSDAYISGDKLLGISFSAARESTTTVTLCHDSDPLLRPLSPLSISPNQKFCPPSACSSSSSSARLWKVCLGSTRLLHLMILLRLGHHLTCTFTPICPYSLPFFP